MRLAYADPPYPGQALRHYGEHPDYAGEVDHGELLLRLAGYDGWVLHTSSSALRDVLPLCPPETRVMAWVKSWASFKPNNYPAYAWEPVLMRPARRPARPEGRLEIISRDWVAAPVATGRSLAGAKPEVVCRWAFEAMGAERDDEMHDLFPGTGAVARAWEAWRRQGSLLSEERAR